MFPSRSFPHGGSGGGGTVDQADIDEALDDRFGVDIPGPLVGGKIPEAQLPVVPGSAIGDWDAATNTPTLIDGTGVAGDLYLVTVAGTRDLGSGSQTFATFDGILYNGTTWQKVANPNSVSAVAGETGDITAAALKSALAITADSVAETGTKKWLLDTERTKLTGVATNAIAAASVPTTTANYRGTGSETLTAALTAVETNKATTAALTSGLAEKIGAADVPTVTANYRGTGSQTLTAAITALETGKATTASVAAKADLSALANVVEEPTLAGTILTFPKVGGGTKEINIPSSGEAAWSDDVSVPTPTAVERLNDFPSVTYAMTTAQKADAIDNPFAPTVAANDAMQRALALVQPGGKLIIDKPVLISGNNLDATTRIHLTTPNVTIEFTQGGALYFDSITTTNLVRYVKVLANKIALIRPRIIQLVPHDFDEALISTQAAIHVGNEDGTILGDPVSVTDFTCIEPYIYGTCGAGMLFELTSKFKVIGAHIENTLKDGIHISRGSRFGVIQGLNSIHVGDDSLAIVGNTRSTDAVRNINATGINTYDTGGRGISVLGGEDIYIEANIDKPTSAGIYIGAESNSSYDLRPPRRVTVKARVTNAGLGYRAAIATTPKDGVYIFDYAEDITLDVDVENCQRRVATIGDGTVAGTVPDQPARKIRGRISGSNCRGGIVFQGAKDCEMSELIVTNCASNGINIVNSTDLTIGRAVILNPNVDRLGNNNAAVRFKDADRITIGFVGTRDDAWRLGYNNSTRSGPLPFPRGATIVGGASGATGTLVQDHHNWSTTSTYWLVVRDVSGTFQNSETLSVRLPSPDKSPGALSSIPNGQVRLIQIKVPGLLADYTGVTFAITSPTLPTNVTAAAAIHGFETVEITVTNSSGSTQTVPAGTWSVVATVGSATANAAPVQYTTSNQIFIDPDCTDIRVGSRNLVGGSSSAVSNTGSPTSFVPSTNIGEGTVSTDEDLSVTATLSNLTPVDATQASFNEAVDTAFGDGPAVGNNQVPAVNSSGTAVATTLETGVNWSIAAQDGEVLPASGFMEVIGQNTAWTGVGVRHKSTGDTVSIQISEGGANINGFGSAVGVTTTAATTATTEAVAALATMRLTWSSGGAALTHIAASMYGTRVIS